MKILHQCCWCLKLKNNDGEWIDCDLPEFLPGANGCICPDCFDREATEIVQKDLLSVTSPA